jgi:hypothetical protein
MKDDESKRFNGNNAQIANYLFFFVLFFPGLASWLSCCYTVARGYQRCILAHRYNTKAERKEAKSR